MIDDDVLPAVDAPPELVAGWWGGLPESRRQLWIAESPEEVGEREGVPHADRHAANQNRLGKHFARVDAALEAAESRQAVGGRPVRAQALRTQHEKLAEWFAQIAEYGLEPDNPPVWLLGVEPSSRDGAATTRLLLRIEGHTVVHRLGETAVFARDEQGRLRASFADALEETG